MRRCTKCGVDQPDDAFYATQGGRRCKACFSAYYKTHFARPDIKANRREHLQEPDVKARRKEMASRPEAIEKTRARDRARGQMPERKAQRTARYAVPEVRDRILSVVKAAHRADPRGNMLLAAAARAKRRGLPFNLRKEDIPIPSHCPVLGIPLAVSSKVSSGSPSLDRLVPELGYVRGNVLVISFRANTLRRDASSDELEKVLFYARRAEGSTITSC